MKVLITGGMGAIGAESSRKRQAHAPTIGAEIKRNIKSGAATENLSFEHELLHHLPDLLGHRLRQPQGCADDFIDLFPGSAVEHEVSFLARREEIRILEHRLKRGSQRRDPLRRRLRRRKNGATDFAGAGGGVQHLTPVLRLR